MRCGWRCAACTRRRSSRDASPRIPAPAPWRNRYHELADEAEHAISVLDRRLTAAGHDWGNPVTNDQRSTVTVSADTVDTVAVLTVTGRLDASTYLLLRDTIVKAALDEPEAVIVDISGLEICRESALAVFTSACWQVSRWPEVPIVLVSEHYAIDDAIVRNGVDRYVHVHASSRRTGRTSHALTARASVNLLVEPGSLKRSRDVVAEQLTAWSQDELVPVAKVIVTALVETRSRIPTARRRFAWRPRASR